MTTNSPVAEPDYDDLTEIAEVAAAYDKAMADKIRDSSAYKKQRALFREQCAKMPHPLGIRGKGAPCHICNNPIDYSLKHPHPESWSLDHALTVKERMDLIMDWGNWRASHLDCNQRRGTEEPAIDIGVPSEDW